MILCDYGCSKEAKYKLRKFPEGHQSGSKNSQFGTCWIFNPELNENKKIKKEELEKYFQLGWLKGRKQNLKL